MKKTILPAIQILVTFALLWWIFHNPTQNREMLAALKTAQTTGGVWWFIPAIAALGIILFLQTIRWQVLLRVQQISIPFWRAWKILLAGMFFNLFLIGATGGDVIKIFFIMRETPDKKAGALLSVFIDRIVGVVALAAVSSIVILLRWHELITYAPKGVLTVAVILGGSLGFVVVALAVDRWNLTTRLPHWLPMHAKIAEAAAAFSQYAKSWKSIALAFLLSLPAHLLYFSIFYFTSRAFHSGVSLMTIFGIMPVVATVTALPISLGGVGFRELLFVNLLGDIAKTSPAIAKSISITGYLVIVFWSLVGGTVYLFYRSSNAGQKISISEMESAVGNLEHQIEENAEHGNRIN